MEDAKHQLEQLLHTGWLPTRPSGNPPFGSGAYQR
jgi:hypothetical protein